MNEAQKYLINHGMNDKYHLMTKNDKGHPIVDGSPCYTSDLMLYWSKNKHDQAHVLLKEAYESIVDNYLDGYGGYSACSHCCSPQIEGIVKHQTDCIVLKATEYLEGEG